jgi:hypothetical protein
MENLVFLTTLVMDLYPFPSSLHQRRMAHCEVLRKKFQHDIESALTQNRLHQK